jgi:predicted ATP-binding protein involved in virulence
MLVRKISLTDVKCFTDLTTIDLTKDNGSPHKWVVLYGDNGLGKSTLLKAFGVALTGQPGLNALLPSADGWVRSGHSEAGIVVTFQQGPHDKSVGHPRSQAITLAWLLAGDHSVNVEDEIFPAYSIGLFEQYHKSAPKGKRTVSKRLDNSARFFKMQIANDEPGRGWLVCGYGPHRRLTGAASDVAEQIPPDGRAARLVTLFHEKAALTSAERWLRELHHRSLMDQSGAKKRQLDAIKNMINTGLLHGGVELADIAPEGVYFKTPFSQHVPMSDLSDGYRTLLALALDLLRHISYCFDIEKVVRTEGERTTITAEGVVLIDEIDAHLHPSWQRTIGAWLHERFPNIQFIVATHSPLIATRVSETEGMVIRLVRAKKGKEDIVQAITEEGVIGLTADQNLTGPNFGLSSTRDVLADQLAAEIEQLRAQIRNKTAKPSAKKRLRELEKELDRAAPATPTHQEMGAWRRESDEIERVNKAAAKAEGKRR